MNEEVELELQSLEAIYMDEFSLISESHFSILLFAPSDVTKDYGLKFLVTLTPDYPNSAPIIDFETIGKSFPLSNIRESTTIAMDKAIESGHGPCIFLLCETITNELENIVVGPKSLFDELQQKQETVGSISRQVAEELQIETVSKKILFGTPFSVEAFLQWRNEFELKNGIVESTNKPLTGKELFLKNVVTASDDVDI
ncbi:hypothetical protein RCL1_004793 [Eukaryota sp. TZLM3-RCL]